jgi:hypothetical protein
MDHQVRLFELRKDAKATDAPTPISGFAVTAETLEDARRIAMARLASERREVRSLSFAEEGGLVAVVHPPEVITKSERGPRSRRKR